MEEEEDSGEFGVEEEVNEKDEEVEISDHESMVVSPMKRTSYDFQINICNTGDDFVTSEEMKTDKYTFFLGLVNNKITKRVKPFIFVHRVENPFKISVSIEYNQNTTKTEMINFAPEQLYSVLTDPVLDNLPSTDLSLNIHIDYLIEPNQAREYFQCVGLLNDGMTCYLNSLIQALYHIKAFRKVVFSIVGEPSSIPKALSKLFSRLQRSSKPITTRGLTRSFGWGNEELYEQHDAQELLRLMLDRLDNHCNNQASNLFKGHLNSYIRAKNEEYQSSHEESFYDLSLCVKGIMSIEESIKNYFTPDELVGSDQYQLPDKRKVDAIKGFDLKDVPPVLCFHLRRFEYFAGSMRKIYSRFVFGKELEFGGKIYQLCSVVSHIGSYYGGHYIAFTYKDGCWLCFDDENVSSVSEEAAIEGNYGNDTRSSFTAYILFYVQKDLFPSFILCPDPPIPKEIIDEEAIASSFRSIQILTNESWKESNELLPVLLPKTGSVDDKKMAISKVAKIPPEQMFFYYPSSYNTLVLLNEENSFFEHNRFYIASSKGVPIYVYLWLAGYKPCKAGIFHINENQTVNDLSIMVSEELFKMRIEMDCYIEAGDIDVIKLSGPISESTTVYFEIPSSLDNDAIDQIKYLLPFSHAEHPKGDSHLSILKDELCIKTIPDYFALQNRFVEITFINFHNLKSVNRIFLSPGLSYQQLLVTISRFLKVSEDQILLFLPISNNSRVPSHRPLTQRTASYLYSIWKNEENYKGATLFYEIAPTSVSQSARLDVTVINKEYKQQDRFSVFLEKGSQTLNDLSNEISKKLNHSDFELYYVNNGIPFFPKDSEHIYSHNRVIVQLGKIELLEDEVLIEVLHCNSMFMDVIPDSYIPFFIKIKKGVTTLKEIKNSIQTENKVSIIERTNLRPILITHKEDDPITDIENKQICILHLVDLMSLVSRHTSIELKK